MLIIRHHRYRRPWPRAYRNFFGPFEFLLTCSPLLVACLLLNVLNAILSRTLRRCAVVYLVAVVILIWFVITVLSSRIRIQRSEHPIYYYNNIDFWAVLSN